MASEDRDHLGRAAWTAIGHLFIAENHRREEIAESLGLTVSEMISLFKLDPGATPSQRELAEAWRCDASWVTATVDRLEGLGLVARVPHPHDRRVKTVTLTPAGKRVRTSAVDRWWAAPACFERLTDTELASLARLMDRLDVPEPGEHPGPTRRGPVWERAAAKVDAKVDKSRAKIEAMPERVATKVVAKVQKTHDKVHGIPDRIAAKTAKSGKTARRVEAKQALVADAQLDWAREQTDRATDR